MHGCRSGDFLYFFVDVRLSLFDFRFVDFRTVDAALGPRPCGLRAARINLSEQGTGSALSGRELLRSSEGLLARNSCLRKTFGTLVAHYFASKRDLQKR